MESVTRRGNSEMKGRNMSHKRIALAVLGGLIVVCACIAAAWLWTQPSASEQTGQSEEKQAAIAPPAASFSPRDTEQLEQHLSSSSQQTQSLALAPMLRDGFLGQQQPLLPAGITITVQPNSFQAGGAHGAIVDAASNTQKQYRLWLSKIDGQWYVTRIEAKD